MKSDLSIEGLLRRNTKACETARKWTCHCWCLGKYHRKKHPEDELKAEIARRTSGAKEDQYELFA